MTTSGGDWRLLSVASRVFRKEPAFFMVVEQFGSLTVTGLREFVKNRSIEGFYEWLGTDYEKFARELSSSDPVVSRPLDRIRWKLPPTVEMVRRFLNQVNSFYAEEWALANGGRKPDQFLKSCSALILYRQGKALGFRVRPIEFGVRRDIDVLDPRRHFRLLRGVAPALVPDAITSWVESVGQAERNSDAVLLLTMALIGIHPYADGNGRLARIAYTWLGRRLGLTDRWLAEADDGEFLRVGANVDSTEHLMGAFLTALGGGYNIVPLDGRSLSPFDERNACSALTNALREPDQVYAMKSFIQLRQHLESTGHFRDSSPRFEALKNFIES